MSKKILFLLPYASKIAPSQRFRIEAYYPLLQQENIPYEVAHFWTEEGNRTLYQKGKTVQKAAYLCLNFVRRWWQVIIKTPGAGYVVIHREAAPLGPPVFEWVIAKLFRKKIIFDFDDAIWIPNISAQNKLAASIKAFWKIKYICKWSHKVSAGNYFLGNWASQYNKNIVYNPTCVDMVSRYNALKQQDTATLTIGWTGSHSTLKYLDVIKPVLEELEKDYRFTFLVICDKEPGWTIDSMHFIKWSEEKEIEDLLQINIGVMPLENDAWSEGKCGFKLIQFLSLGIPAVASPVGVNKTIIEQGANGFLAATEEEWKAALKKLLDDESARVQMGITGKQKMQRQYSIQANAANFLSLFS